MSKTIFALGGGSFGEHRDTYKHHKPSNGQEYHAVNTTDIDRLILKATNKKKPKLLLIVTASEDGQHNLPLYEEAFRKQYEGLGAIVDTLYLITRKTAVAEIKSKILNTDAIYVSGGNSARMMKTWRRLGIDKLLKQAYDSGTVMSGQSAGSICWFTYGNSNSFYTNKPFRVTAMGWVGALICPHYDTEPFRQEPLKQMLKRTPKLVGLAVDEHAAIEIKDGSYKIHSFGPGGKVHRCYWRDGRYNTEEEPLLESYKGVDDLLSVY